MAEINLFLIFLGSIGFDLLIGDPRFLIHPVQIVGFYIKKISDYFTKNFGENKRILFWGGFFIAISSIGISFSLGKLIELSYVLSRTHFFSAKIEDIFTFVPSRLVLITLPLVSPKINEYGSIIKKSYLDGKKYDSPNAGISEAIFAYISGVKSVSYTHLTLPTICSV